MRETLTLFLDGSFDGLLCKAEYSTGKSDRADQLGGTTTNNFEIFFFFAKSYFSIVIFNILKDENDSSKGKKVYLVSTTKLRFIRVPPK